MPLHCSGMGPEHRGTIAYDVSEVDIVRCVVKSEGRKVSCADGPATIRGTGSTRASIFRPQEGSECEGAEAKKLFNLGERQRIV